VLIWMLWFPGILLGVVIMSMFKSPALGLAVVSMLAFGIFLVIGLRIQRQSRLGRDD
jgi:hypothetical protein